MNNSPTAVGPSKSPTHSKRASNARSNSGKASLGNGGSAPDKVDAINRMFAQFQCTYHNQFHRAFPDEASLTIAKQYWLGELQEHPPQVILAAARELTRKSVYLPSLAAVVQACSEGAGLLGLPDARRAYLEACGAPSPKRAFAWSHPVVYHAGRATGWQLLAREAESVALPVFEHYYARYCRQVLQGEDLELQPPPPLPAKTEQVLPREELQARLQQLRAQLKL